MQSSCPQDLLAFDGTSIEHPSASQTYHGRVSIHVRETGKGRRYDVKLRDRDGVMHTKTFRTKREAVDYEADQRAQLSAGTFIAPRASATTVEDLATRWLAAGTKRDSSRARDRSIVHTHLLPGLGPKRTIGTVTRADCQALVDRWVAAGLAPRTVIRVAAALRSMFGSEAKY